jgi:hypothetical protein
MAGGWHYGRIVWLVGGWHGWIVANSYGQGWSQATKTHSYIHTHTPKKCQASADQGRARIILAYLYESPSFPLSLSHPPVKYFFRVAIIYSGYVDAEDRGR